MSQQSERADPPPTDLFYEPAASLLALLRTGQLSAEELLDVHLARIEQVNPAVNAIVTLDAESARATAHELDIAFRRQEPLRPLHGIPVAVKDTVETAGMRTTRGSPIFADTVPDSDALLVERLRQAGAIVIGKTNVPEFAAGSQTFNAVFGATRNPWDLRKTSGGSSGGAAAALASGMVPLADGTDFGGSLRNPASFCGVVGMRPSPGRVPSWPRTADWFPFAVAGPMARTVTDAALLLSVLAGPDPRASFALTDQGSTFSPPLDRDFRGVRVAFSPDLGGLPVDPAVRRAIARVPSILESIGCKVDEACPSFNGAEAAFTAWRAWSFELQLGALLDSHRDSMSDSVIWNIEEGRRLTGPALGAAERERHDLSTRVLEFLTGYEFLALPVSQVPPFDVTMPYPTTIDGTAMETYIDWMRSCAWVSMVGLPAISVPCGFTEDGLPVGVQLVSRLRNDRGLLEFAYAFEQATGLLGAVPAVNLARARTTSQGARDDTRPGIMPTRVPQRRM